jgi:hypothetical protein
MSRWVWFIVCAILGLVMLICGLLVPAHLRAVDVSLLQKAGRRTPALLETGSELLQNNQLGAAEMVADAARQERLLGSERFEQAVINFSGQHPDWQSWGGGDPLMGALTEYQLPASKPEPVTDWVVRLENRGKVLNLLRASTKPGVQELMRCQELTNTTLFPPSRSASGQAFDAALSIGGLLLEANHLNSSLSDSLQRLAAQANHGGGPQPFEQLLMDFMSLGQRFNWNQLQVFVGQIPDPETLRLLSHFARHSGSQLPALFSAVVLTGNPAAIAQYLVKFSQSGLNDVGESLQFGAGSVNELLRNDQRLYSSTARQRLAAFGPFGWVAQQGADYSWSRPQAALTTKWVLYIAAGFLLALAFHFVWPRGTLLERPLQVRGFHFARELLFALGFLLAVLLLSEPFLSQESQKLDVPFRLRLSTVASAVQAGVTGAKPSIMNQVSVLTLLLFFVLQGLLYIASVVKLAEIRRQQVPPRVKLKLLENEDHLFDAGLYLGFVGTIISLILVSLNIITFSLMAAYSSTSFGIVFVSFFKIFHLRSVRRRLLLESEMMAPEPIAPAQAWPATTT